MFCPNCGNNCADANFCPKCGTKLPQKVEQPVEESLGQTCPRCGGILLGDKSCALCGAQLEQDVIVEEDSYEIPYKSMYIPAARAHIHIAKSFVSITKKGFFKKSETQIPYEKLRRVRYCRNELLRDSISFYWDDMAASGSDEENVITLNLGGNEGLLEYPTFAVKFQIFYMFKLLAPHVELETSFAEQNDLVLERFSHIDDLDDYYSRFSPLINQAVSAIMKDHALPKNDARDLIDTLFIKQLKELYQSEPLLAVRDYHRIKAEQHREYEEMVKEMKERGLKRYR